MQTQITVKEVDETTFQELKAYAVGHKMKVGSALTMAMHNWLTQMNQPKGKLSEVKTFKGGVKTKYLSEQIDEILYS